MTRSIRAFAALVVYACVLLAPPASAGNSAVYWSIDRSVTPNRLSIKSADNSTRFDILTITPSGTPSPLFATSFCPANEWITAASGVPLCAGIANSSILNAMLADGSVTTTKIADNNVTTTKIADNNVTNAKLAQMAQGFSGRATGGTGNREDLTPTQATALLNSMVGDSGSGGTKGLVGAPAAGDAAANKFWGADATWRTALVRATAQATTSGATFDFTGIPSWARKITCVLSGVSLSGTDNILIQIGDSGGISSSGYVSSSLFFNTTPAAFAVSSTAGFIIHSAGSAVNLVTGRLVLTNISGNQWVSSGNAQFDNTPTASNMFAGSKTLANTLDRVRFTVTGANTFDAGLINIAYE